MNVKKVILSTVILFLIAVTYMAVNASEPIDDENASIIGRWVSESDPDWELTFVSNGNKCHETIQGKLNQVSYFAISNTSPQCGEIVPVEKFTSYLKLTNVKDSSDYNCYEINGITSKNLSLRPVNNGKILLFVRQ